MMNAPASNSHSQSDSAPRLVLISAEPDPTEASQPLRILGSEPRPLGHFRLTDR